MLIEGLFPSERILWTKSQGDPDDAVGTTEVRFLDPCLTVENHVRDLSQQ